jgi:hypothetical protein
METKRLPIWAYSTREMYREIMDHFSKLPDLDALLGDVVVSRCVDQFDDVTYQVSIDAPNAGAAEMALINSLTEKILRHAGYDAGSVFVIINGVEV